MYKKAGVDVERGDALVGWLKADQSASPNPYAKVLGGLGGFAGLVQPNFSTLEEPLLVAGTDGVGTKLLLAIDQGDLSGVGIDLVAMCVNDLYCIGATPIFFIDYYATGVLSEAQFKQVLSSIKAGLAQCSTPLLGGETAELPGLYQEGHLDLAGFVVGVVERKKTLGPERVAEGDVLLALPSSGFHSNGYSLLRKWLGEKPQPQFLSQILAPTRIYHEIPNVLGHRGPDELHALANITGGGISGNLVRVLPDHLDAIIEREKIQTPAWMTEFLSCYESDFHALEAVLNMGIGMIAIVSAEKADAIIDDFKQESLAAYRIGSVTKGSQQVRYQEGSID